MEAENQPVAACFISLFHLQANTSIHGYHRLYSLHFQLNISANIFGHFTFFHQNSEGDEEAFSKALGEEEAADLGLPELQAEAAFPLGASSSPNSSPHPKLQDFF